MHIDRLDHLVLTVVSIELTCAFYCQILGMKLVTFGQNRKALCFGSQKINLHLAGHEFEPKSRVPTPGSADLCFITKNDLKEVIAKLNLHGIEIEEGPVSKTGATGSIQSVYVRDPDQNLIEISTY
ncbi:MAG: VOC family protein [Cohaesibacteraceae bacterium]|nr:VOC family protein [Cohaesibacteraceae bacterium]